jgi:hypothetical protein
MTPVGFEVDYDRIISLPLFEIYRIKHKLFRYQNDFVHQIDTV